MSTILTELHDIVAHLEADGHQAASKLRDLVNRIKTDLEHVVGDGTDDLQAVAAELAQVIAPQLKTAADQALKALLKAALEAVKPVVDAAEGDGKALLAEILTALAGLAAAA